MTHPLLVLALASCMHLVGLRFRALGGYVLLVAGAILEVTGTRLTTLAAGGMLVATGTALVAGPGHKQSTMGFCALFLAFLGMGTLGYVTGSEHLDLMGFRLLAAVPRAVKASALTLWVALILRLVVVPWAGGTVPSVTRGPGWWSAVVVAARWGEVWPWGMHEACVPLARAVVVVLLVVATAQAVRESWESLAGWLAGTVGVLVAYGAWFGGSGASLGSSALGACTALGLAGVAASEHGPRWAGYPRALLLLSLCGFPLGSGYWARMKWVEGVGAPVAWAALLSWILPLALWLRVSPLPGDGRWRVAGAVSLAVGWAASLWRGW